MKVVKKDKKEMDMVNGFNEIQVENYFGRRFEVVSAFGAAIERQAGNIVDVAKNAEGNGYALVLRLEQGQDRSGTVLVTPAELPLLRELERRGPVDVGIFCGEGNWPTPQHVIDEIHAMGFSHRVPPDFDPRGLVRGVSRIFIGHVKGIMKIEQGSLADLTQVFLSLHDPKVNDLLNKRFQHDPSRWLQMPQPHRGEIFKRFQVSFAPGFFGYTYFTGAVRYLKPDETDIAPADAQRGFRGVRAKRIKERAVRVVVSEQTEETQNG
jgi:hypothetical protein